MGLITLMKDYPMPAVLLLASALFVFIFSPVMSAEEKDLERDEYSSMKKKMQVAPTAIKHLPQYLLDSERLELPVTTSTREGGKFNPITSYIEMRWADKAAKDTAGQQKIDEAEFQKKYQEAMAKGDYELIGKLTEEMQQRQMKMIAAANLQASATKLEDMNISILFNHAQFAQLDPDHIVFEVPGAVAVAKKNNPQDVKGEVTLYIDPVTLKEPKKILKLDMKTPDAGVSNKVGIYHITIIWRGPLELAKTWAKQTDVKVLLSLIEKKP